MAEKKRDSKTLLQATGISRRTFLTGAGATGIAALGLPVLFSGCSDDPQLAEFIQLDDIELNEINLLYRRLIPADKELDSEWLASLSTRGHPLDRGIKANSADGDLDYIGMPVGGIACGTVYLSGDGRLFLWDYYGERRKQELTSPGPSPGVVFKKVDTSEVLCYPAGETDPTGGANFLRPPTPDTFPNRFRQAFSLEHGGVEYGLDRHHWQDVIFTSMWPVGRVTYQDSHIPLRVELSAYSPFAPLELDDSSLPVTVVEIAVENVSDDPQEIKGTDLFLLKEMNPSPLFLFDPVAVRSVSPCLSRRNN